MDVFTWGRCAFPHYSTFRITLLREAIPIRRLKSKVEKSLISCRTATLDLFFDLAESKVAVFLCSILTSDGIPFCFGKNSFL